jgi:serine/threonine protein kinase
MAPELLTDDGDKIVGVGASPMHDVWSLGVLLFVMLTDSFPWRRAVRTEAAYLAIQGHKLEFEGIDRCEQTVCLTLLTAQSADHL